jgi:hypothetical protein
MLYLQNWHVFFMHKINISFSGLSKANGNIRSNQYSINYGTAASRRVNPRFGPKLPESVVRAADQ